MAAIDLGAEKLFVGRAQQPVRSFGGGTRDLHELADWLRQNKVRRVALEATGVLWILPHDLLQAQGFEGTLFHGAHARNLPERKTDVADGQWHARLHGHGLLQPCFVPPEPIRELRTYCRLREDDLSMAAQHLQPWEASRALHELGGAGAHAPPLRQHPPAGAPAQRRLRRQAAKLGFTLRPLQPSASL